MGDGRTMAVLGGGPVGLGVLVRARAHGWDARLYERGRVGENVRGWGHVRMFSPLGMNLPDPGRLVNPDGPAASDLLTGSEYVEHCLEPLAEDPSLAERVLTATEVVAVSRDSLRKGEEIARPERGRRPFRLLLNEGGRERLVEADVVVDATGTFGTHNWLGGGGIPAVGERSASADISYSLPDVAGRDRDRFLGRHTLVVGAGHSAATAVLWLGELARANPKTRVTWVTRTLASRPVPEVECDPLAERAHVAGVANAAAERGADWLTHLVGSVVVEVRARGAAVAVAVTGTSGTGWIDADALLALVGYRPDLDLTRELQVQTCWATEGTYPLAAALLAREGVGGDCLRTGEALGSSTLLHPEPGFFTVGAKSYGRNPSFLIRAGLSQVEQVFDLLRRRAA